MDNQYEEYKVKRHLMGKLKTEAYLLYVTDARMNFLTGALEWSSLSAFGPRLQEQIKSDLSKPPTMEIEIDDIEVWKVVEETYRELEESWEEAQTGHPMITRSRVKRDQAEFDIGWAQAVAKVGRLYKRMAELTGNELTEALQWADTYVPIPVC